MSFRAVPFAGSRWVFGLIAPLALVLAVWLPWAAWNEGARGARLVVGLVWTLFGLCLALCLYNPRRFRWAGSVVATLLLGLIGGYDLLVLQAWQAGDLVMTSRAMLLMGFAHVVLGWPALVHLVNVTRQHH